MNLSTYKKHRVFSGSGSFSNNPAKNWIDLVIDDLKAKNTRYTFPDAFITELKTRFAIDYVMPDASTNYYNTFGPGSGNPVNDSSWFIPLQANAGQLYLTSNVKSGTPLFWDFGDEIITAVNVSKSIATASVLVISTSDNWAGLTNFYIESSGHIQPFTGLLPRLDAMTSLQEIHGANCGFTDVSDMTFSSLWHYCVGNNTFSEKTSPVITSLAMEEFYYVGATWNNIVLGNYPVLEYLRLESMTKVSGAVPVNTSPNLYRLDIQLSTYTSMSGTKVPNAMYINCYWCEQMTGAFPDIECTRTNGLTLIRAYRSPFTDFETQTGTPFGSNTTEVRFDYCAMTLAGLKKILTALDIASVTNLSMVRLNGTNNAALDSEALALVASIEARNPGLTILHN